MVKVGHPTFMIIKREKGGADQRVSNEDEVGMQNTSRIT